MADRISIQLDRRELRQIQRNIKQLRPRFVRRGMRQATSAAIVPWNKEAKRLVPIDEGVLKKSLGRVVRTYRQSGVTYGLVGPRRGFGDDESKSWPELYGHVINQQTGFLKRAYFKKRRVVFNIFRRQLKVRLESLARQFPGGSK